jgi:hypothetical protein
MMATKEYGSCKVILHKRTLLAYSLWSYTEKTAVTSALNTEKTKSKYFWIKDTDESFFAIPFIILVVYEGISFASFPNSGF